MRISNSHVGEESLSLLEEKALSDIENDSITAQADRFSSSKPIINSLKLWIRSLRPSHLRSAFCSLLLALIPSFIYSRIRKDKSRQDKLSPTAYLDGMRSEEHT